MSVDRRTTIRMGAAYNEVMTRDCRSGEKPTELVIALPPPKDIRSAPAVAIGRDTIERSAIAKDICERHGIVAEVVQPVAFRSSSKKRSRQGARP